MASASTAATALRRLATTLLDGWAPGAHDLPPGGLLVRLSEPAPDGAFEMGVKDLDGAHPADTLLGFTAPDDWWGLGVLAGGWAAGLADGDDHEVHRGRGLDRASQRPDRARVTTLYLAARDGTVAGGVAFADGRRFDEPPPAGMIPDTVLRALGRPTAPPAVPVSEFYLAVWLMLIDLVGRQNRREGRRLPWSRLVKLLAALPAGTPARSVAAADGLASTMLASIADIDWTEVHRWATRGSLGHLVDRELARWMDEGMLCRWLLSQQPPLPQQLEAARQYVTRDAAAKLVDTIDLVLVADPGAVAGDAA